MTFTASPTVPQANTDNIDFYALEFPYFLSPFTWSLLSTFEEANTYVLRTLSTPLRYDRDPGVYI